MSPKQRREGGQGGGRQGSTTPPRPASPSPAAMKRPCQRPLGTDHPDRDTVCCCTHLRELFTMVQGLLPRVQATEAAISRLPEELWKVLTSHFNHVPSPGERIEQNLPPTYKLSFENTMSDKFFTKKDIQAAAGGHLKIRMVSSNQQGSICPQLLSSNVKIVVLDGDFNEDNRESWTSEKFDSHIVRPRDKVGVVLTGKVELKLKNREAYLQNITFGDNSKFTRSGKFRLGVKLIDKFGERVQEGQKKFDIPKLDDEVWRLEKIGKKGPFRNSLEQIGITKVKRFLRMYYKDENALRSILINAPDKFWIKMVNHAKKCDPGNAIYSHFMENKKIRLYFSSLGRIVGATVSDQYYGFGDLDTNAKAQVIEWCKDAYECMDYSQHDYEMYNCQPRSINCSTFQGSITPQAKFTEPSDQIIHEADELGASGGNGFSGAHSHLRTLQRLGSRRVRALPSAQENHETVASFDSAEQLVAGHRGTQGPDCITGSVTLQPTSSTANAPLGPIPPSQGSLNIGDGIYPEHFTNDDSSWCPEQQEASQCESAFSLSSPDEHYIYGFTRNDIDQFVKSLLIDNNSQFSAANLSELPADVRCFMVKLLSCRRWIKLTAAVRCMAIMASSKKRRASKGKALEQEGWSDNVDDIFFF